MSCAYTPTNEQIWNLLNAMQPDENGELPENIFQLEDELSEMLTAQYDGFTDMCRYYKDMEAQDEAIKAEIDRLKDKKAKLKTHMDRIMEFMKNQLGEENKTFGAFSWVTRKTPETLQYFDGFDELQLIEWAKDNKPELITEKVTVSLDKAKAKAARDELPWGVVLMPGRSYKIK